MDQIVLQNDSKSVPFNENELKNEINRLRQLIEQNERDIKNIFRDINLHNAGSKELKAKRDELNSKVKELIKEAAEFKAKRDSINREIADLKSRRDQIKVETNKFGEIISNLKKERDELNKTARGRLETLELAYKDNLDVFINSDIPLDHEIDLFKKLVELRERLSATMKANEIHGEITIKYEKAKEVYTDADSLHNRVRTLADESQKYHESMIAVYSEVDKLRKEADMYHSQLAEKYKNIAPLRKKIDSLKSTIAKQRDELSVYLEKMKEFQNIRESKINEEKRELAKNKFQKSGRLSLEDLKVLMDNKDITFE